MIHFTELEQTAFLQKRGWTVDKREVEQETHIHGSRFITNKTEHWYAIKGSIELPLQIAFNQELKNKLINE